MSTLGVVVLSVCGMKHLTECLESIGWADAVVVLHVGRGEPAVEPGRSVSTVIRKVHSTWEVGEIAQKVRTDWVLHLWGEERVGAELQEQLRLISRQGFHRTPLGSRKSLGPESRGSPESFRRAFLPRMVD